MGKALEFAACLSSMVVQEREVVRSSEQLIRATESLNIFCATSPAVPCVIVVLPTTHWEEWHIPYKMINDNIRS